MSALEQGRDQPDESRKFGIVISDEAREEVTRLLAGARAEEARRLAESGQPPSTPQPVVTTPVVKRDRFYAFKASEFDGFGQEPSAVEGVFPARGVAAVYGPSQVGKSVLSLDLTRAMVNGSPWFGRDTLQRNVWYIAAEGQSGLRQRVRAIQKHFQQQMPDAARFVFDAINLMKDEDVDDLKVCIKKHGGVQVIVIDTLACAMAGGDENSSKDMGKVLNAAKTLQQAIDGLVILVHHTGKDASRGMRGHSSLLAAVDVAIEVKRHEKHRSWHLAKTRDAEDGMSEAFILEKVELEPDCKGRPRSSIVVVPTEMPSEQPASREPAHKNQKLVRGVLRVHLVGIEAMADGKPATITFDQAVDLVKDSIESSPKHQKVRAQEAIRGLIKGGFLLDSDGVLSLPSEQGADG